MFVSNNSQLQKNFSVLPVTVLPDKTQSNFSMLQGLEEKRTENLKVSNIKLLGEGDMPLSEIGFRRWVELKISYLNPAPEVHPGRQLSE